MKVAVAGYGNMGKNHVRVLRDMGLEVVIAEPDTKKWPFGVDRWFYPSLRTLLEDEAPDAVVIATPTETHYRLAEMALSVGCAVLVEKPLTSDLGDAAALLGQAQSRGHILECGLVERWNPAVRVLRNDLGALTPRLLSARRSGLPSPVVGQGVTSELATHDIDIANWLTGSVPVKVQSARFAYSAVEALLTYEGDVTASISADWLSPRKVRQLRVVCDEGTYDLDYIDQSLVWHPVGGEPEAVPVAKGEPLRAELEHFVGRVKDRSLPSAQTAEAAMRAMMVVAQITGESA